MFGENMRYYHTILVMFFGFIFFSCNNSVEPNQGNNPPPGRRDYIWKVDSLSIPFANLQRIWGNSPSDIWTIGPGGDADKTVFRFNGSQWYSLGLMPFNPTSIYGFAQNDVWIGARGGEIWHYAGSGLTKKFTLSIPGFNFSGFECIWGDSPNNAYAIGYAENNETYRGVIARFDGNSWQNMNIPATKNTFVKIQRGLKSSNDYFIFAFRFEQFAEDTSYIYKFDGTNLNKVYQGLTTTDGLAGLSCIDDKIYIREGYDIYEYTQNQMKFKFKIPDEAVLWGRNENDILLGMLSGVAHYNGTDIEYIYNFNNPNIRIIDAALFPQSIVILAIDYNSSYFYLFRGSL